MSIWSVVEGVILIPRDSKFSARKSWEELYDEIVFSNFVQDSSEYGGIPYVRISFKIAINLDGLAAARVVQEFCDKVTAIPGYRYSQITAEIRFT